MRFPSILNSLKGNLLFLLLPTWHMGEMARALVAILGHEATLEMDSICSGCSPERKRRRGNCGAPALALDSLPLDFFHVKGKEDTAIPNLSR
jgi:hypothetical protein